MSNVSKAARLTAVAATALLVLAACGGDDGGDAGGQTDGGGDGALAGKDITIGVFSGWEEGLAASYLWGHILEEEGATVEYQTADPGPIYSGVAQGQFDVGFDAWLPATHEDYWAEHGEKLEDLGTWFTDAPLTIAVNEDAPIQSLDELAGAADQFDNRLVGIEPGAGLTRITKEEVIPTYGLDDMQFIESSTPAMLAELEGAIDSGKNVVVTLWRPHWAYDAFPIRDLEDPQNALGDPEEIHSFGREGFATDFPEVAKWIGNFTMTDEQLHSLEKIMFFENDGEDNEKSVDTWLQDNPDFISNLKAGNL
ncbi:glycine betaine ABC transporter substrate-binding protein [Amycolatopsis cihanbeyliensis]|uniref:Glycine betaine/proline transport system substrate-binding protein n=1 Tax=Amycolatopsis cihanbeyliensis TaxID=1128664 RepID=A0A542DD14_AMYCI|nr:glycine betaine ABC transporter substrate-binding protein [Amycolatopsis cihanbeyliensis]TQJ00958.1 glycine betaine/proline transport system substrate-binding protein [Amycolatopsis cihanbeyliensis]